MARFPSSEWASRFESAINQNSAYADAAKAWEGEILLLVLPDTESPGGSGILLDLHHGVCRSARFVADANGVATEFVYQGGRSQWARLLRHEIDPVKAWLDGTFQVKGNLAKAMRFTRAAKELVETAASIPTEF